MNRIVAMVLLGLAFGMDVFADDRLIGSWIKERTQQEDHTYPGDTNWQLRVIFREDRSFLWQSTRDEGTRKAEERLSGTYSARKGIIQYTFEEPVGAAPERMAEWFEYWPTVLAGRQTYQFQGNTLVLRHDASKLWFRLRKEVGDGGKPKLPSPDASSSPPLVAAADTMCVNYAKAMEAEDMPALAGVEVEIPAEHWTEPVRDLEPLRVFKHRANAVVARKADGDFESGTYIVTSFSSYRPKTGDDGFEFTALPETPGVFSFKRIRADGIFAASGTGDLARVRTIVVACPGSVMARDLYRMTPLHWAAGQGHADVTKFLLTKGAAVNAGDMEGLTPLHLAARFGYKDIAKALIDAGAEVNATNNERHVSPLNRAAQNGHFDLVKLLAEKGADLDSTEADGWCPLQWASGDMAWYLVAHGAKVDVFSAISLGDATNVTAMVTADPALLNQRRPRGDTPLHWAVARRQRQIAELLISLNADVNATDNHGMTPLHQAAWSGAADMVELLLAHGANPNAECKETEHKTPLSMARLLNRTNIVQMLRDHGAER